MAEPVSKPTTPESDEQRQRRTAWVRERLAEAYADIDAGRAPSGDQGIAWLENEIAEAERLAR